MHKADVPRGVRTRLGFLYPGHAAEDDYPRMADVVGSDVEVMVEHTSVGTDAHEVGALLDLGSAERLRDGAERLAGRWEGRLDAAVWACTSGSFVFGRSGAREQVRVIGDALGVPASSTSFAFVHALAALGVRRVAVAATYPRDVADRFAEFLAHDGVEVVAVGAEDVITAAEVGTFGRERVLDFVTSGAHPDAGAVLVPDTALHTAAWIDDLEERVGRPVLTANQVTMWEALRLAGAPRRAPGLGRLFELGVPGGGGEPG